MNKIINIEDITIVAGKDDKSLEKLISLLSGTYIQWASNYYHPIDKLSQIEINNILSNPKDEFYDFNLLSLNLYNLSQPYTRK